MRSTRQHKVWGGANCKGCAGDLQRSGTPGYRSIKNNEPALAGDRPCESQVFDRLSTAPRLGCCFVVFPVLTRPGLCAATRFAGLDARPMKNCSRLHSVSASLLPCVLLAFVLTQTSSAYGLLMKNRSVVLHASRTLITLPCPPSAHSISGSCRNELGYEVTLTSETKDFHKKATYTYVVTGGQVVGEGSEVTWELSGVGPGIYTATVEVRDNNKNHADSSVTVTVAACSDCVTPFFCPTMTITCYDRVKAGTPITCRLNLRAPPWIHVSAYKWSARSSNDLDLSETIKSNDGYASIPTSGLGGHVIYTTVEVKGIDPSCNSTASGSTRVEP